MASKRFQVLSLARHGSLVVWVFLVVVGCVLVLTNARSVILSAVRAYVGGEGLYAQGQKDAVFYLITYARSHEDLDYQHFLIALAVPLGDQQARLELEKPEPDLSHAYAGFINGHNHPDDVANLAWLFRRFRHTPYMAEAIEIWSEADGHVVRLRELGSDLHDIIGSGPADAAQIGVILAEVDRLNRRLTILEDAFSRTLGEGNRWLTTWLEGLTYLAAALLVALGGGVSWMIVRRTRESAEALRASEARKGAILEVALDCIITMDHEGRIVEFNAAAERTFGFLRCDVVGRELAAVLVPPRFRERHRRGLAHYLAGGDGPMLGTRVEMTGLRADGSEFPLELAVVRIAQRDRPLFTAYVRDITERRRTEDTRTALLDVATDISGTLDLAEMLARVQRRVAGFMPCERVLTYYWDEPAHAFRLEGRYGLPDTLLADAEALHFRPGDPIVEHLTSGQSLVLNPGQHQGWLPDEVITHFQIGAMVLTPLRVHGRILGALVAVNPTLGTSFEPHQVLLFESVAQQLAMAIEAVELYRERGEEEKISAALALAGREMISSLDRPVLLDRLCRLTTQLLACDVTYALLWAAEHEAYVMAAGHGDTPAQRQAMAALRISRAAAAGVIERLREDEPRPLGDGDPLLPPGGLRAVALSRVLAVALRRAETVIGVLLCGSRMESKAFSGQQERIARGIAQVASLALENARLVEELARANRVKSDFVATMSHELRTPLNVIMGYTDLLREEEFGPVTVEQAGVLQRVSRNTIELRDLINATLDLGRLEAGRMSVELQDVRLADVVAEVDAETRELQNKPRVRVEWHVPANLPEPRTDPVKLKLVLKNLVSNALKFTEEGRVTVSVSTQNGGVDLVVADTGIGIAPELQAVIFEAFRQGDGSSTRRFAGVGLGLYIVHRLLDLLGGRIAVDSELGQGSTFHVWLPLDPTRGQPVA